MGPPAFSKTERRERRDLAGRAYEAELHAELEELFSDFQRWKNGELSPSGLSEAIHEFHQGPARELFSLYNASQEQWLVARAVAQGFLDASALSAPLREKLQSLIEFAGDASS